MKNKKIDYLKAIESLVKKAGNKATKSWLIYKREDSVLKGKTEVVTKIDKETEIALSKGILKAFPEHSILGEEYGLSGKKSDYVWIIDPIDGTTNFTIHNPLWSISIGLAYKDEIIFGLVYIPVLKELFWAYKGKGSFLNGKRLQIKPKRSGGKEIHTFCHGHEKRDLELSLNYYKEQKIKSLDCRQLGSAAIELSYVASSRVDSIFIPGARSWDVAAGALIAAEAGATLCDSKGKTWSIKSRDIIAVRPDLKTKILSIIKKADK